MSKRGEERTERGKREREIEFLSKKKSVGSLLFKKKKSICFAPPFDAFCSTAGPFTRIHERRRRGREDFSEYSLRCCFREEYSSLPERGRDASCSLLDERRGRDELVVTSPLVRDLLLLLHLGRQLLLRVLFLRGRRRRAVLLQDQGPSAEAREEDDAGPQVETGRNGNGSGRASSSSSSSGLLFFLLFFFFFFFATAPSSAPLPSRRRAPPQLRRRGLHL